MQAAGLLPHEQVDVLNANNGARLTTHVIEALACSDTIALNGPAAHLALPGYEVIILVYAPFTPQQAQHISPPLSSWMNTTTRIRKQRLIPPLAGQGQNS